MRTNTPIYFWPIITAEAAQGRFTIYVERREDFGQILAIRDNLENPFLYIRFVVLPELHALNKKPLQAISVRVCG